MSDIVNLQRKVPLSVDRFRSLVDRLAGDSDKSFSVAFVSDRRMKQLNELFRGKNVTTDVLSFAKEPDPFDLNKDNLGDIVISAEQAQRQALESGLSLDDEIKQLILHGYLHLLGMDHAADNGEMNERELELRHSLGI
jgi:probable rRNA maturation factor